MQKASACEFCRCCKTLKAGVNKTGDVSLIHQKKTSNQIPAGIKDFDPGFITTILPAAAFVLYYFCGMNDLLVTIIQTNISWENKLENLTMLEKKIASAGKTEIIVLPEMFSTGFSMQPEKLAEAMDGESVSWMRRMAAEYRIILTGSLMIREEGRFFNRLIWMLPSGQCGFYNKRHLFAYANEQLHYSAGEKRLIASAKGWKINLQVCYDLRFPVWSRQQVKQHENGEREAEYDLLVYVANWPERRSHAWKSLLTARAIENQCYVVGVNRIGNDGNNIYHSGNSMIINPLGEAVFHNQHEEIIFTAALSGSDLQNTRQKLPFWKDADSFNINQ